MVTILEPRKTIPVESAPAPEALQPGTVETERKAREWRYSMPFAGVRYFSFDPAPRPAAPMPSPQATRRTLAAKLIDEKVFLI